MVVLCVLVEVVSVRVSVVLVVEVLVRVVVVVFVNVVVNVVVVHPTSSCSQHHALLVEDHLFSSPSVSIQHAGLVVVTVVVVGGQPNMFMVQHQICL